jgi:hypothetical protein
MVLTTHHFQAPRSRMSRAIPLLSLWALRGLSSGDLYLYEYCCCVCYDLCKCVLDHRYCATGTSGCFSTNLTEVFLCIFLSCQGKCQGITCKDGAWPALPKFFLLSHVFRSLYAVYCLCVNVSCATATGHRVST